MNQPVPQQASTPDAARGDSPSALPADRPLPPFPQHAGAAQPHSPIEREIERSERALAALAAARALARASSNDSQLEPDAADGDIDTANWVRTEYASLDQSVRSPQEDVPHPGAPRNLVGGSFNPGISGQQARAFSGPSMSRSPIKTRGGAQARFLHEARHAPRAERPGTTPPSRLDLSAGGGTARYDKPAVVPMLVNAVTLPAARATVAPAPAGVTRRVPPSETTKFVVAMGVGAVAMLMAGGLAWNAGWLAHNTPDNPALVTARVAAQAEAARVLSSAQQEIAVTPAAGTAPHRTDEEINAALAAAARAAAVPVASVHAAAPARAIAPTAPVTLAVASTAPIAAPAAPAASAVGAAPPRVPVKGKDSVAAAIANAQARADSFLASGSPAVSAETPPAPVALKTAP